MTLRHAFNGSGGGDVQTSATVTYTTGSGSGTLQLAGTDTEAVIPAGLAGVGSVTWSVVTRGQGGTEGPASSGNFILAAAPAAPVITDPVDGQTATGPAGTVTWLSSTVKRPQIQWNQLDLVQPDEPMFAGLGAHPWFYFVHSLHGVPTNASIVAATCDYGGSVNAAFRQGNVFAAQFHPEKSASAGLGLLANFVQGLTSPTPALT